MCFGCDKIEHTEELLIGLCDEKCHIINSPRGH
jgi:hypothetical protein